MSAPVSQMPTPPPDGPENARANLDPGQAPEQEDAANTTSATTSASRNLGGGSSKTKGLNTALKMFLFRLPLYRFTLGKGPGKSPRKGGGKGKTQALSFSPKDIWSGHPERGRQVLHGHFTLCGNNYILGHDPFETLDIPELAEVDLHQFEYLRDLHALGGHEARSHARFLITSWIERFYLWDPLIWKSDVIATRLAQWFNHYDFFGSSADEAFNRKFFQSATRQARHLRRSISTDTSGRERLTALKGLLYCALCLPGFRKQGPRILRQFERTLSAQILEDGSHIQRSPTQHLLAFCDAVEVRSLLHDAQIQIPRSLEFTLRRMGPVLKFLRTGDGGLCLFNSSFEEDPKQIDKVLTASHERGRVPQQLKDAGFTKAMAGKTTLFMDCGFPEGLGATAHAGTLSFELSHGKHRILTNCGTYTGDSSEWLKASRATAAHTSLTVDDTSSANITAEGKILRGPRSLKLNRREHDGNILIEASHDGYQQPFRLLHTRRIYLDKSGEDIRGEDMLSGQEGRVYTIRFHLHPKTKASLAQDGKTVMLKPPGSAGWLFKSNGAKISLEGSVYMGLKGHIQKTQQIIVSGAISPKQTTAVKWAFKRQ